MPDTYAFCRGCGMPLKLIRKRRKNWTVPCNLPAVPYWKGDTDTLLQGNGKMVRCTVFGTGEPAGYAYCPHYVTCPKLLAARKKRRR